MSGVLEERHDLVVAELVVADLGHRVVFKQREQVLVGEQALCLEGLHDFPELFVGGHHQFLHEHEVVGVLVAKHSIVAVFVLAVDGVAIEEIVWRG